MFMVRSTILEGSMGLTSSTTPSRFLVCIVEFFLAHVRKRFGLFLVLYPNKAVSSFLRILRERSSTGEVKAGGLIPLQCRRCLFQRCCTGLQTLKLKNPTRLGCHVFVMSVEVYVLSDLPIAQGRKRYLSTSGALGAVVSSITQSMVVFF